MVFQMQRLALTGPYRTISAGGSFAIQVDGSDKSGKKIGGELVWDCYSVDAVYDKVLVDKIYLDKDNPDSIAEVTYAVLSNAVQATLQVHLKLKTRDEAGTVVRIHGEIMVNNEIMDIDQAEPKYSVVLFHSAQEDEMEVDVLTTSDDLAGIIPVPLARSVVVAPVDMPLVLEVKLYAAFSPNNEFVLFHQNIDFPLLDHHTVETEKNGVVLQVTSPHIHDLPEQSIKTLAALATTLVPG